MISSLPGLTQQSMRKVRSLSSACSSGLMWLETSKRHVNNVAPKSVGTAPRQFGGRAAHFNRFAILGCSDELPARLEQSAILEFDTALPRRSEETFQRDQTTQALSDPQCGLAPVGLERGKEWRRPHTARASRRGLVRETARCNVHSGCADRRLSCLGLLSKRLGAGFGLF